MKLMVPIIYIVLSIIGVLMKNVAEEQKRKQKRLAAPTSPEASSTTITSEEREQLVKDRFHQTMEPLHGETLFEDDVGVKRGLEVENDLPEEAILRSPIRGERQTHIKQGPSLAQAVIMSEIVRQPRAKRPWPSR